MFLAHLRGEASYVVPLLGLEPRLAVQETGSRRLEPVVGVEPTTVGLRKRCATLELRRRRIIMSDMEVFEY